MNASIKLLEAVTPAVVSLTAQISENHPSASVLGTERHGSGVSIDSTDLVLTVNYIVLGANHVAVTLADGTESAAKVIVQDFGSGIAVIQLDSPGGPGLQLRSSTETALGDDVAIVAAAPENARRVSDGVIVSFTRFDANWEYSLDRSIMTTARNAGLGGAPLIDAHGQVLGIVSLDLGEIGRSTLAIPVDYFLDHKDELLKHGRRVSRPPRAWVGIFCYTFRNHIVVAGMLPGSPAERAGLKPGDVVLAIDGQEVGQRHELYEALWSSQPGQQLEFSVFRESAVRQLSVTAGDAELFFA
jgi:S1-C subfamily serine protease